MTSRRGKSTSSQAKADRQRRFLDTIYKGGSYRDACAAADVLPDQPYLWRRNNPDFVAAWRAADLARAEMTFDKEALFGRLKERALVSDRVMLACARAFWPELFDDKIRALTLIDAQAKEAARQAAAVGASQAAAQLLHYLGRLAAEKAALASSGVEPA